MRYFDLPLGSSELPREPWTSGTTVATGTGAAAGINLALWVKSSKVSPADESKGFFFDIFTDYCTDSNTDDRGLAQDQKITRNGGTTR